MFSIGFCPDVYAYSCRTPSIEKRYQRSQIVFTGKMVEQVMGKRQYLLEVYDVYKGVKRKEIYLSTGNYSMGSGYPLIIGQEYLIYANGLNTFSVSACSGTKRLQFFEGAEKEFLENKKRNLDKISQLLVNESQQTAGSLREIVSGLLVDNDNLKAKEVLNVLLKNSSGETLDWAYSQLMSISFKQSKAEEVWALYKSEHTPKEWFKDEQLSQYVHYAAMVLNKRLPDGIKVTLKKVQLSDLQRKGQKIEDLVLDNVHIINSDFQGSTFSNNVITGLAVHKSNFKGANFQDAKIGGFGVGYSDFRETNFRGVTIGQFGLGNNTKLNNASFQGATFEAINFHRVNVSNADFTNATFKNGKINHSNFERAILQGARFENVEFTCSTKWPKGFDPIKAGASSKAECDPLKRLKKSVPNYPESLNSTEFVGKDFSGKDLKKDDFRGKNLQKTNFTNAKLYMVLFSFSDLTGAKFDWAELSGYTDFSYSTLKDISFKYSLFNQPRMDDVKFMNTAFNHAVILSAKINNIDAQDQDFSNARLSRGELKNSNLKRANFSNANLERIKLEGSNFSGANFTGSYLSHIGLNPMESCLYPAEICSQDEPSQMSAIFRGANFTNAIIEGSDLRGGDFREAIFKGASLFLSTYDCHTLWPAEFNPGAHGAVLRSQKCEGKEQHSTQWTDIDLSYKKLRDLNLRNAVLNKVSLRGAQIRNVDFSETQFHDVDLTAALVDCQTKWPRGFDPVAKGAVLFTNGDCDITSTKINWSGKNLSGARLDQYQLAKADLRNANLSGTQLYGAVLYQADLRGADLRGANLTSANIQGANFKGALFNCKTKWGRGKGMDPVAMYGAIKDTAPCVSEENKYNNFNKVFLTSDWRLKRFVQQPVTEQLVIEDRQLHRLHLPAGSLKNITFRNSSLRKSRFRGGRLENVNFINSDLRGIVLSIQLRNVDFSGSDLRGVKMGGHMVDVNFSGADLRNTEFTMHSKYTNVNFSGADIRGAKLSRPPYVEYNNVNWEGVIYDCHTQNAPLPMKACED